MRYVFRVLFAQRDGDVTIPLFDIGRYTHQRHLPSLQPRAALTAQEF